VTNEIKVWRVKMGFLIEVIEKMDRLSTTQKIHTFEQKS